MFTYWQGRTSLSISRIFLTKKITKGEKYHEIMFQKKNADKKKSEFHDFFETFFWYLFQHAGRNSTNCWYWIHGTTTIKPLEFYSKLPFEWLGPFTPQLMKLIKFESPEATGSPMGTNVISKLLLLWFSVHGTVFVNHWKCRNWVCFIKNDLSGNTVWPQTSGFQKLDKIDYFWLFK